jgi:hypothetical protein
MVGVGYAVGFVILTLALAAIAAAIIGFIATGVELSKGANWVFPFEPILVLVAAPAIAVLALSGAALAAAISRRL